MGLLSRMFGTSAVKAAEGDYRDGPYSLPVTGGLLPAGSAWNFWQLGQDPVRGGERSTMVEACVSAYSQTLAMCPGGHWRVKGDGGRERVVNSALNRVLRKPNPYQSISDFLLNLTRQLYLDGNAYAIAIRNDRFEISELHLMNPRSSGFRIAVTGDVFYSLGGNELIERRFGEELLSAVPARDVLHVRLHTPRHPLRGESPLLAAAVAATAQGLMTAQQLTFLANQSRPSGTLNTEAQLTKEQVEQLRERWNEQSRGLNSGGVPILTNGLKWTPMATSAADAQMADMMKMTREDIALAFRVPLQVFGLGGQTFSSTELLMQSWLANGLGFTLNHIEEAFGQLFQLKGMPDEYLELDTSALLRSAHKDRIDALVKGVQGGVYSPNEARRSEGYPDAEGGDDPRVQQQLVPLSFGAQMQPAPIAPDVSAAPPAPDETDSEDRANAATVIRQSFRASYARHAV